MSVSRGTIHKCSRCLREARPGQRYCWNCHAEWARGHRKKHREFTAAQKAKAIARRLANYHASKGHIQRLLCEVCLSPQTQPHHEDYSKPLEVRWFCREHHLEHEGKQLHKSTIERYEARGSS